MSRCPVMRLLRFVMALACFIVSPCVAFATTVASRLAPAPPTLRGAARTNLPLCLLGARPAGPHTHWRGFGDEGLGTARRRGRNRAGAKPPRALAASGGDGSGEADDDDATGPTSASAPTSATEYDGNVLVLGAGWVGSRLAAQLLDDGKRVFVTNRPATKVGSKPAYFRPVDLPESDPPVRRSTFEITMPETWDSLPPPESLDGAVLTFALAKPFSDDFWHSYLSRVKNVICYSSTSVYQVDSPGQTVTEETPIRNTGRALAEAGLQEQGATVLTVAGIFGERKSPRGICTCLSTYTSSGGALNGRKRVNMVHVDDIIAATTACLRLPRPSQRINVAGHHFSLSELISHCKHPEVPDGPDTDYSSKCVCSDRLLTEVLPPGSDFVRPFP